MKVACAGDEGSQARAEVAEGVPPLISTTRRACLTNQCTPCLSKCEAGLTKILSRFATALRPDVKLGGLHLCACSAVAHPEGGDEGRLWDLDLAELAHSLFALLQFVEELAPAGHVAPTTFGEHVFA